MLQTLLDELLLIINQYSTI